MVVRIAGRLLEQTVNREISQEFPIKTWLLDAWCEGSGTAIGNTSMNFAGAKLEEPLPVRVSVTMFSRAQGYAGPVVTTARTDTTFEAIFYVDFDGTKFYQSSSWVSANCDSTLESICATTRLGRRLIQRVAWRVAPGEVPRYDYAAARMIEAEVDDAARETIRSQLKQLNEAVSMDETLTALAATDGYQRVVSKTDTFIQVRVAPEGQTNPLPPKEELLSDAPIEIWIHPNSGRPLLADLAIKFGPTQDVLRNLLPGLPQAVNAPDVSIAVLGDWDVIKVGRLPLSPSGFGLERN